MDTTKTLQAALTAAFTAATYYFGLLAVPLIVLFAAMIIDYVTGMAAASHNSELSSKKGFWGIVKKICYLALVCVGMGVDWLIYCGLSQIGISLNYTMLFGVLVTIWLIINEMISILENLSVIGVPLPGFLKKIVGKLKIAVENTANNESEEK